MKTILTLIAASSLLAALAIAQPPQTPRYTVTDLGTFGGPFSVAFGIDNAGRVGGAAALPNGNVHAFISGVGSTKYDLGTLGGPNSQASAPNGMLNVAVLSETSTPDPLKEDFCGFGDHLVCLGAIWDGVMRALHTLGGNNAMALGLNNRGQVIGVAENSTKDKSCPSPQVLDFEPVIWGPGQAEIQALPTLPGDTVGFALGINDRGQVVGSSGTCANTVVTAVGLFVGPHAVLWEDGPVTDLGNLGGKMMGKAAAINNRGEVAGFSDVPDGSVHSFLWTRETGMQDLGALGKDVLGDPAGINNSTQVVGGSCDSLAPNANCRAFLWQDKKMMDLNDLIPADSPLYLIYALGINDAGEIVGFALQTKTGELHAYVARPVHGKAGSESATPDAQTATTESRQVALPENVGPTLRQRMLFGRLGARPR
jgi:probable HAF family extracellular repeat protein